MEKQFCVVDNDQMLLLNNLSLLTGIYKKSHETENNSSQQLHPNVVLTTRSQGKILPTHLFNEHYSILNKVSSQQLIDVNKLQGSVILLNEPKDTTPNTNDKLNKFIKLTEELQSNTNRNVIVIEKNKCQITCIDPIDNQQTIYSFLSDNELGLVAPKNQLTTYPKATTSSKAIKRQCELKTNHQNEILKKQTKINHEDNKIEKPCSYQRTRSGRCVRQQAAQHNGLVGNESNNMNDEVRNLIHEIKDNDYRCYLKNKTTDVSNDNEKKEEIICKKERHVPPESICPKCKKIFLGRRLKKHFAQHPDHIMISNTETKASENMTLFNYLVEKLYKNELNEDQRADIFLNEINDLVEQLRLRSSRLIRNTTGPHLVTTLTACVIGIPEGQYSLDMSAVLAAPDLDSDIAENTNKSIEQYATNLLNEHNCLDYTALSMSLDVNITDEVAQKLNLSAGGKLLPPSEESLLRSVEDLVPKRINKNSNEETIILSNTCNMQHYEQANDNAVEAVAMKITNNQDNSAPILELPVDFFSI